ncbi:MAG: CBS domain-containing protein [Rhizobacter sp.]|nr:CBS domain-containing protein [Rhizobacter sp.]
MARRTHTIGLDDTVQEVEALLAAHDLTWAPVVGEQGVVLGVISSADLLQFHAAKGQPDRVSAWQLCTYKPISVTADASISSVAALMVEHRIHHVVVMDGGTLCGVVSSLDFVKLCV